jgi:hypothetical protein
MRQAVILGVFSVGGLIAFVAYVFVASSRCEVESPQILNWTVSPRTELQKEQPPVEIPKGEKKGEGRTIVPVNPPSYSVTQGNPANDRAEQKGSGWLTKFFCDAKISDITIAFFSYLLAVVTAWLGWATIGLWQASNDEFKATHRPKIRIKHFVLASDLIQDQPICINLTCVNSGTSNAFLQQVGMRFFVVRNGRGLPIEPDIPAIFGAGKAPLESGLNYPFLNLTTKAVLSSAEYSAIQTNAADLYFVGYVSYFDGAERMRITGFCRVLDFPKNSVARPDNCRFRKFDDADYEYED